MNKASKIIHCQNEIEKNNSQMVILTKRNERLFDSLMRMINELDPITKERYDKELASDNWKKYSEQFKDLQ